MFTQKKVTKMADGGWRGQLHACALGHGDAVEADAMLDVMGIHDSRGQRRHDNCRPHSKALAIRRC